ncbi:MAG: carbonic anhydrase [Chloroflexi bacterium]|nr:carbonic anhydrase [Chloroflexota bacterium]
MSDPLLKSTRQNRHAYWQTYNKIINQQVTEGQHPTALMITCSDSRIMPETMLGLNPGDMFMLRNIANVIPPYVQTEIGIVSVLEYAVITLKVPHIIVCGHTECGGIKGLDEHIDMGTAPALSRWLDVARPAQRDVDFTMRELTPDERHIAIVQRNVINQLQNIASYPFVQTMLNEDKLTLHGWVYHLEKHAISYYDTASTQFIFAE